MRCLSFKELAGYYFPDSDGRSASVQLSRWIYRNRALTAALADNGYRKGQRWLTPRQVRLIMEHLGEPG